MTKNSPALATVTEMRRVLARENSVEELRVWIQQWAIGLSALSSNHKCELVIDGDKAVCVDCDTEYKVHK